MKVVHLQWEILSLSMKLLTAKYTNHKWSVFTEEEKYDFPYFLIIEERDIRI